MKFDVTVEPWLSVKTMSGETKDVSLLEILEEAHQLKAIDGLNPMEEYSVLRFLSVFLTAVFRPGTWEDKLELLDEGRFDMEKVRDYIEKCRAEGVSFDIFDEKRPFMQATPNPEYDRKENLGSSAKLNSTRASGNNHIHYDHRLEKDAVLSPAEAFIGILTSQVFCPSDGQGYSPCINYRKGQGQPLFLLPQGKTFFETLVLSVFTISGNQKEVEFWRSEQEVIPKRQIESDSKLYGMFFPSRRIRLILDDGFVKRMYFQPGLKLISNWTDPHVAYYLEKGETKQIVPSLDREGWRNIGTLAMQFTADDNEVPAVLRDYAKILDEQNRTEMSIVSFGVVITGNAKYNDLQRGTFTLDTRLAKSVQKSSAIGEAASVMDEVGVILQKQLKKMIAPDKPKNKREKQRGENDVQKLIHAYYTKCEPMFYAFSDEIATLEDDKLPGRSEKWKGDVVRLSRDIFDEAQEIYCSASEELFRAEKARKWLNIEITKLMKGR